jgi:hypothetical protein
MALTTDKAGSGKGGAQLSGSGRWSALWIAGMVLVFVGERVIATGGSRGVATVAGLLCVLGAMAARLVRAREAAPDRQRVERTLLGLYAVGLVAVVLYFFQSDLPTLRGHHALERSWPKLANDLGTLWPAIWAAAAFPIAFVEMAYAQMAKAPRLEEGRVRDAMYSGFGMAAVLVFTFAAAYITSERNKKVDLAYFRTTRPGEVTRKIVRNLDQPVEAALFFPPANEVRDQVEDYFRDLGKESGQLKVTHYDFDLDPKKAREYGVSSNGIIVFVRGGRHEQLGVQLGMDAARATLRVLDKEVQQRLMSIVKPTRAVLLVQGHGERSWDVNPVDTDKRSGLKTFRDMLADQSYDVRTLSAAEGLMSDVPKDAAMVMILGPQKPFAPEELAALNRYIDRGGHLFIALDPENKIDMHEVLDRMQLTYKPVTLANDQVFARKPVHTDADRANLVTATYSSHPSVTTLVRFGARAPVILPGAGWIDPKHDKAPGVVIDMPIKAHHATFEDKNGNFNFDPDERRMPYVVGATSTKKDARLFLLADSDSLSDDVIKYAANQVMAMDIVHWLMGDEAYSGPTTTEADVPITHTRKQDVVWFYGTIFVAPALVIAAGLVVTRRRRRQGRRRAAAGSPPPSAAGGGGIAAPQAEGAQS